MNSVALTGRVTREATAEQAERIIDAFAKDADVLSIAKTTGIGPDIIRNALDDPEIAKRAMVRKKNLLGVFLVGEAIDSLQEIVRTGKNAAHVLKAVELIQGILEEGTEEAAEVAPAKLEEALDSLRKPS